MTRQRFVKEAELAALAKRFRIESKKKRAQAAREMNVSQTSIFHAEESPHHSYVKLRVRMIETYSRNKVEGVYYRLKARK